MSFLDSFSYPLLVILAVFVGLAPFHPEPHLVEKWRMLRQGELRRPIDIFDVVLHLTPTVLLLLKLARDGGLLG